MCRIALILSLIFAKSLFSSDVLASDSLTLQDYLSQVKGESPDLKSSSLKVEGSEEASLERKLTYMPKLTLQGSHTVDHRQFSNALFAGRTDSDTYTLGLEKQFDFGMNAKLSYNLFNNYTTNASSLIYPGGINQYTQGQSQIDITQSLWRNFLGKENEASSSLEDAKAMAIHYGESFRLKSLVAQAEMTYHRVAVAREAVKLSQELLDRSQKILDWTTKRVKDHLADKVDSLQAGAATQARALDLENNLNEERAAKMAFNVLRNQNSSEVKETVTFPSTDLVLSLKAPEKITTPDELKAAQENERITKANQELALQKTLPDVSLFATAGFNGVNQYASPAIHDSLTTDHPLYTVGVKLSVPLYFWETSTMRSGRVKEQLAAEADTRQKTLDVEKTWYDLSAHLKEAKSRLKMADQLVTLQKEKLDYEKYRFNLGRTTTYQVLTFEQDYAQAVISRLRIEQEILNTFSQLKVYAKE